MAASKRQRDDHDARPSSNKKSRSDNAPRKGFSVGPANLPDGTYKRKGMPPQQPATSSHTTSRRMLTPQKSRKSRRT